VKQAALFLFLIASPLVAQVPGELAREGLLITIDVSTNQLFVFRDGELVRQTIVATGSDKILRSGDRVWWFRTPRGLHTVVDRVADPIWNKPDWAFVEEGKRIPPRDSPQRLVRGKLGKYALDLGGGVLLHGTDDPKSIGRKASHGCIRLHDDDIAFLWREAAIGTPVYIFASQSDPAFANSTGLNDLDMRPVTVP